VVRLLGILGRRRPRPEVYDLRRRRRAGGAAPSPGPAHGAGEAEAGGLVPEVVAALVRQGDGDGVVHEHGISMRL
jgi:hypothetical protein